MFLFKLFLFEKSDTIKLSSFYVRLDETCQPISCWEGHDLLRSLTFSCLPCCTMPPLLSQNSMVLVNRPNMIDKFYWTELELLRSSKHSIHAAICNYRFAYTDSAAFCCNSIYCATLTFTDWEKCNLRGYKCMLWDR